MTHIDRPTDWLTDWLRKIHIHDFSNWFYQHLQQKKLVCLSKGELLLKFDFLSCQKFIIFENLLSSIGTLTALVSMGFVMENVKTFFWRSKEKKAFKRREKFKQA